MVLLAQPRARICGRRRSDACGRPRCRNIRRWCGGWRQWGRRWRDRSGDRGSRATVGGDHSDPMGRQLGRGITGGCRKGENGQQADPADGSPLAWRRGNLLHAQARNELRRPRSLVLAAPVLIAQRGPCIVEVWRKRRIFLVIVLRVQMSHEFPLGSCVLPSLEFVVGSRVAHHRCCRPMKRRPCAELRISFRPHIADRC